MVLPERSFQFFVCDLAAPSVVRSEQQRSSTNVDNGIITTENETSHDNNNDPLATTLNSMIHSSPDQNQQPSRIVPTSSLQDAEQARPLCPLPTTLQQPGFRKS